MIDTALEAAIDGVGRERVFDRARAYGWSLANTPEKWVWWGIVAELRKEQDAGVDGQCQVRSEAQPNEPPPPTPPPNG